MEPVIMFDLRKNTEERLYIIYMGFTLQLFKDGLIRKIYI